MVGSIYVPGGFLLEVIMSSKKIFSFLVDGLVSDEQVDHLFVMVLMIRGWMKANYPEIAFEPKITKSSQRPSLTISLNIDESGFDFPAIRHYLRSDSIFNGLCKIIDSDRIVTADGSLLKKIVSVPVAKK